MANNNTLVARATFAIMGAAIATTNLFGDEIATASFGGNEIRLYDKPLSYEVVKDGCVMVPRTEIGIELDGSGKLAAMFPRYPKAVRERRRDLLSARHDRSYGLHTRCDGARRRILVKGDKEDRIKAWQH